MSVVVATYDHLPQPEVLMSLDHNSEPKDQQDYDMEGRLAPVRRPAAIWSRTSLQWAEEMVPGQAVLTDH